MNISLTILGGIIRTHNETLSIIAMCIGNPDCLPAWNQSLRPSPNSNRLC